jgi:hypothetical protein
MQYRLTRQHEIMGVTYPAGAVIEINLEHIAAKLMSDHEGLLVPIYGEQIEQPAVRQVTTPPQDRMVRKGSKRTK